jgi:hypothetical protein
MIGVSQLAQLFSSVLAQGNVEGRPFTGDTMIT